MSRLNTSNLNHNRTNPIRKPVDLAIRRFNHPFPGFVYKSPLIVFLDPCQAIVKTPAMMTTFHLDNNLPGLIDVPGTNPFTIIPDDISQPFGEWLGHEIKRGNNEFPGHVDLAVVAIDSDHPHSVCECFG